MSKAKMYGMQTKCVPNSKADARRHHKLPEKILLKKKDNLCKYNEGVLCVPRDSHGHAKLTGTNCETCGWNPAVTMARNAKMGITTPPAEPPK